MAGKILGFPTKTEGGGQQSHPQEYKHVIYRRLDELGKNIAWLAKEMHVSTTCLYDHINRRHKLNGFNFATMMKVLEINLDYYYSTGKYARQGAIVKH